MKSLKNLLFYQNLKMQILQVLGLVVYYLGQDVQSHNPVVHPHPSTKEHHPNYHYILVQLFQLPSYLLESFLTIYAHSAPLFVYGPGGAIEVVSAEEGVRQGDSLSSLAFCSVMNRLHRLLLPRLIALYGEEKGTEIYNNTRLCMYMDDVSLAIAPRFTNIVSTVAADILQSDAMRFTVSSHKCCVLRQPPPLLSGSGGMMMMLGGQQHQVDSSSALSIEEEAVGCPFPDAPLDEAFVIVGGVINDQYDSFNQKIMDRNDEFFKMLQFLNEKSMIKKQALHAILYFCGLLKPLFYAKATPPAHSERVLKCFQDSVIDTFGKLIGVSNLARRVDHRRLHDQRGASIPDICGNATALYDATRSMALSTGSQSSSPTVVRLTTRLSHLSPTTSETSAASDSQQQRQQQEEQDDQHEHPPLVAHEQVDEGNFTDSINNPKFYCWIPDDTHQICDDTFQIALAAMLGVIPDEMRPQCVLSCRSTSSHKNRSFHSDAEIINHALHCYDCNDYHPASRHQHLKIALANTMRKHGITLQLEPTIYYSGYDQGNCRPDLTATNGVKHIATDITIVTERGTPGAAAAAAAEEKIRKHNDAVMQQHHVFIPFALESTGFLDASCFRFIRAVCELAPYKSLAYSIKRSIIGTTMLSLAHFRAKAIRNMCDKSITTSKPKH